MAQALEPLHLLGKPDADTVIAVVWGLNQWMKDPLPTNSAFLINKIKYTTIKGKHMRSVRAPGPQWAWEAPTGGIAGKVTAHTAGQSL